MFSIGHVLLVVAVLVSVVSGYIRPAAFGTTVSVSTRGTALFAHHVNKKITKRMMDRRPKKSRPSDITRNNVNFGKCITKIEGAPSDYTIMSAEDYAKVREDAIKFWDTGDSSAAWMDITSEDMVVTLCPNVEPLPEGGVQKRPPLVKSGTW